MQPRQLVYLLAYYLFLLSLPAIGSISPSYITFPANLDLSTRRSEHFTVVFKNGSDKLAIRSLNAAEKAYKKIRPIFPDAPDHTWIVLASFQDSLNGYSLNLPYPHFVVFVAPPAPNSELAALDDWFDSVVLHEFVHTLHIYPAHGLWSPLRFLFGSWVIPNGLLPRHLHEGIATFLETQLSEGGRGESPLFKMYRRKAVQAGAWGEDFVPLDKLDGNSQDWPHGTSQYFFGYYLYKELWKRKGAKGIHDLTASAASNWPYLISTPFEDVYGEDYPTLWKHVFATGKTEALRELKAIEQEPLAKLKYLSDTRFGKWDIEASPDKKRIAYRASSPTTDPRIEIRNVETGKVEDTIPIEGSGTGMCWRSLKGREKIFFLETSSEYGYVIRKLQSYDFKTKKKEMVEAIDFKLEHLHQLACNHDLSTIYVYKEHEAQGQLIEIQYKNWDSKKVRKMRSWNIPERSWVSSILLDETVWFTLRRGPSTHLYRWNWEGKPTSIFAIPGHAYQLRKAEHRDELNAIWDRDGRYEVFSLNKKTPNASKLVAVAGGVNSYDHTASGLALSSYEHGGYDIAITESRRQKLRSSLIKSQPKRTQASTNPNIEISESNSYSAYKTLYPRMWIPNFLIVPDGFQVSAYIPGFDISQKHNYGIYLGYELHSPSSGTQDSLFGSLGYTYRFGQTSALFSSAYFAPSYFVSGQAFLTQWGGSFGWSGKLFNLPPSLSLKGAFQRQERFTFSNGTTDLGKSSVGLEGSIGHSLGFKTKPGAVSPHLGTSAFVSYAHYYILDFKNEGHGTYNNFFRMMFGLDQYLPSPIIDGSAFHIRARFGWTGGTTFLHSFYQGGGELAFSFGQGTFLNRGFPAGTFAAERMFTTNIEYNFPILDVYRGWSYRPLFLERLSGALVADVLSADSNPLGISNGLFKRYYGSVGAELKASMKFSYYIPAVIRFGVYRPTNGLSDLRFVFALNASI